MHRVINAVLFQLAWFGFVAGAARDAAWWGLLPFILLGAHALREPSTRRSDLLLAALVIPVGVLLDGSFARSGLLAYGDAVPALLSAPWWILAMWLGFAWTFNHSLVWLQKHVGVAALLGAVAGPFSYYVAAHAWGALAFTGDQPKTLVLLAVAWSAATAGLVLVARRIKPAPAPIPVIA